MALNPQRTVRPNPAKLGQARLRYAWPTPGTNRNYLEDNYFEAAPPPAGGGNIKVELSLAYQVKPVKWHDGVGWLIKPLKWHNGSAWVPTTN